MAEAKTKPTAKNVLAFLDESVESEQKRQDSLVLIDLMERITGKPAVIWGESIIGFDSYATPTGNWPILAFSPRKTALTLYVVSSTDAYEKRNSRTWQSKDK